MWHTCGGVSHRWTPTPAAGSTWLGTTRGYTYQQLDTALRAVVAPLSPAVPDDGDVIAKRSRTSWGRAVETHVATADRTELTT